MDKMVSRRRPVAVIGGGISGVSAAYFLARRGQPVVLFERQPCLGGLAGSFPVDGVFIDRFYHHFYTHDLDIIRLLREIGLGGEIHWQHTSTGAYCRERMYDLSSPRSLLAFDVLPFVDRVRLGLMVLRAQRGGDWQPLEDTSAKEWILRQAGAKVYETLWGPLLRGKFGPYAEQISAAWLWSKFNKRGGSRSRGQREMLGYVKGGLGLLFTRLEEEIEKAGGEIFCHRGVRQIRRTEEGFYLDLDDGGQEEVEAAIVTLPTTEALSILPADFDPAYRRCLEGVDYLGAQCLILRLTHSLSGAYWINNTDPTVPFLGVIEHTNMLESAHYGGFHYVYLPRYLPPQNPEYHRSTEELYRAYLPHLQRVFPGFRETWVAGCYSWSDPYGQPIVKVGYSRGIPPAVTPWPQLFYLSMCQIYPEDRQMSNSVKLAGELVARYF